MDPNARAGMVIALPGGLVAGGVQVWALRLANGLAERGRAVTLIVHRARDDQAGLAAVVHPGVRVVDLSYLPRLEDAGGDLSTFIPPYRAAVDQMHTATGQPVIASPNLLGDCYGIFASIVCQSPDRLRIVGWQHSPIPYDGRILEYYEPVVSRFVPVSEFMAAALRARLPHRAGDVRTLHCGADAAKEPREVRRSGGGGSLRMIYVGRMENDLKRVVALVHMADALAARGVDHELTLVGDGPAAAEVDALARTRPSMKRLPAMAPHEVAGLLSSHDVLVLGSRIEGLSLSMLEAMGQGCVPVVVRTPSGVSEVIEHGVNGVLVETPEHADVRQVGAAMARGVASFSAASLAAMSAAAWKTVTSRFSMTRHLAFVEALIDQVANTQPLQWPVARPCAFTAAPGALGSGAVPADGAARLRLLLGSLDGRRVVLHGTGRHTLELAPVLTEFMDRIVGFTDDDPSRHGGRLLTLPIVGARAAATLHATDVVISSWMNQDLIWARRDQYEQAGLRVHRLY